MRFFQLSLLALLSPVFLFAQKKNFTIQEATLGMGTSLATKGLKQTSWQPETNNFYFVYNNNWVRINAENEAVDTFLKLKILNQSLYGKDSLKAFPSLTWLSKEVFYFTSGNQVNFGNMSSQTWQSKTIQKNADNIFVAPNTNHIAYTVANNLWINDTKITDDKDENIINGKAVHRDEFGIDKGIFFSPKGNYLAYYRMDQTMVKDYPVVDWSQTPAVANIIKYPMAGGTSHQVSLWIYSPESKQKIRIKTGLPLDQYLTCVSWSPDEKYVFIALLNRGQNFLQLNQYDAATGEKIKTLFTESDSKYVQPLHPMQFLPNSNNEFVWWSQRDGFMHLYLYNTNGKMLRQITSGKWLVNDILAFNQTKKEIIFSASKESPMEKIAML